MKTEIFVLVLSIFALSVKAQEQKYYEFGWNGKYGIVDFEGHEIAEPIYDWKSYTLNYKSSYIALNRRKSGALIINTSTGKQERLNFLADTYLINLNGTQYLYAYNDKEAFLMNHFDLEQRKILPKKYEEVRQVKDYLIGYLKLGKGENIVDILSEKDFEIKLKDQKIIKINDYKKVKDGKRLYAFVKENTTVFYDENLKQITTAPQKLDKFEDVQHYLLSAKKITIQKGDFETEIVGPAPDYPHINTSRENQEDGYVVFSIYQSRNDFTPFFKFKWNDKENSKILKDRYNNKIDVWKKKKNSHNQELQFLFYTDVNRKRVLFPQKYWNEIGLQVLEK